MVSVAHSASARSAPLTSGDDETQLLRGGEVASALRKEIRAATAHLISCGGPLPKLVTVSASDNPAAVAYRRSIVKTLDRVGLAHEPVDLPDGSTDADLQELLKQLCDDASVTGVLVLMPLPPHLSREVVNEFLNPMKDVDGITPANAGRLHLGLPCLAPSTPQGGILLLDHYRIPIEGAHAVVVGRSNVVGRPLAALLLGRNATVTICHSRTVDLESYTRRADIIAVATGAPRWLNESHIRPGATVLDFGINVVNEKVVGDADYAALLGHAGAITPVPGGTGPVTALVLARNTVAAAFAQLGGTMESLASAFDEFVCPQAN
ncbi:MAG: bifunctional 5,10-methylenetetrahydrofolate dehydrogenase/5,10-methenyltetrahydrofolate cyclohydrolase [Thermomicrobiales bacterium]|nr:bifunctional 5,10-methylenetetrahydrofolate dehydrogenase/5,10-methenyltetrahydrofolate cyclohydrolase [Thermomicrobiales bacterium]